MKNQRLKLVIPLAMATSAALVCIFAPPSAYEILGILVWLGLCAWNAYAYFSGGTMFGFGAANTTADTKPQERLFFLVLTLIAYFLLLLVYAWSKV